MNRIFLGAAAGVVVGILALAAWGAYFGFVDGGAPSGAPPGLDAAWRLAFYCVVFFAWVAVPVGGVIGALAGLGSWLVRPRADRPMGT